MSVRIRLNVPAFVCALWLAGGVSAAPLCGNQGDGDGDCRIALNDYADFSACLAGPATPAAPECQCYDMNFDGAADLPGNFGRGCNQQ